MPRAVSTQQAGRGSRILIIIAVVVAGLTAVFGVSSVRSSRVFSEYRSRTLDDPDHPVPWRAGEPSVDDCIDFAIDWATGCPGIQSWCEAEVPRVVRECVASHDRTAYCDDVGDTILSTGFGYHACEERRREIAQKYAKRWHKKYCAKSYRAVADHCRAIRAPEAR